MTTLAAIHRLWAGAAGTHVCSDRSAAVHDKKRVWTAVRVYCAVGIEGARAVHVTVAATTRGVVRELGILTAIYSVS